MPHPLERFGRFERPMNRFDFYMGCHLRLPRDRSGPCEGLVNGSTPFRRAAGEHRRWLGLITRANTSMPCPCIQLCAPWQATAPHKGG